ncbi:hypothetical protein PHYSODRAFT_520284 [Phytophthora sojae]|uniref:Uncharacterized protein n=1 Tax=Phytophthora sojae (strain P6497) TaxID=1094619 RepID=G5A285_PHYSP|nr:hypothetical protein PHYSODRAFT_520284 [Phytophthora sojae]EGZ11033.1 hypothetical protein PHYSODRAFT_520284 [Phytophthora sojae]|eukprot:XP_009533778.1 hypothetical protein PHYSODRAFT_520284 [Phytophthora sojae]
MQRGPSAPDSAIRANSVHPAAAVGPAHGALPAITTGAPPISAVAPRGVSPNVAKRAAWSTPRDRLGTPERRTEQPQQQQSPGAFATDGAPPLGVGSLIPRPEQVRTPTSTSPSAVVAPLEDALEVLLAVLIETDDRSDRARRRQAALEETERLHAAEELELERTRLAADEQLQMTLELLQAELARERRLRSTGEGPKPLTAAVAPPIDTKGPSKRQAARLATRLRNSPLKPRTRESALHASVREVKLHELRDERARWQRDYETMREQVIEEKARQVALFQRLEMLRRSHAKQLSEAEAALRASQADVERLQTRLAQARVSAAHEARRTASLVQNSRSERQRLVCALAETRHKFREWKEGEAATLRATREQAVHALRTEYELKLARHQEEKQKLRDKVKDLEVSLRLLQRDRQLSPGELSERKGTLLQNNSSGTGFGDVGAADFIEAQGRIHELEALLQLSKERQEWQDALLRVSEAALARLSQERELDALENLSLPSPAVALVLSNLTGDLEVEDDEKTYTQDAPTGGGGTDLEKEILRRKSIALSAEVNRYQKIVVQSMEEVRALKESRRRSRSGSISSSAMVLSPREAYLLEELAASQREVDAMRIKLKKKRKKDKAKSKANIGEKDPLELDIAVKMIQTYSKGFLARREFIRKKLAIGKIKARYRGYLVRKNYEALGGGLFPADRKLLPSGLAPQEAPNFLMVTEAMQYKMQIVEPHYKVSYLCEGTGSRDNVDVVLRVSKDPPVVQLQLTSKHEPAAIPRVTYFHLFETIALLPYEDEEIVLETASEKEIARIFASRLVVQRKGSEEDYHFFIVRPAAAQDEIAKGAGDLTVNREARTLLTELPVQPMESRAASASSEVCDAPLEGTAPPGQEIDLDLLIQEARTDPLENETAKPTSNVNEPAAEDPTARIRRLVKRLSSNSFDSNEQ